MESVKDLMLKNKIEIIIYFVLIPFLYPRGFAEYFPVYKNFFDIWLYCSIVLVGVIFLYQAWKKQLSYKKCAYAMILYYVLFIVITFGIQKGISEGLQKLFAAPVLYIFFMITMKEYCFNIIRCIGNWLILVFVCNITMFSPLLWSTYFEVDKHMVFIGHVQVASQISILGVLISFFWKKIGINKYKVLFILSVITMFISKTMVSYIVLFVVFCGIVVIRHEKIKKIFQISPTIFVYVYTAINVLLTVILEIFDGKIFILGRELVFNGRFHIWYEALKLLKGHWLTGYGAYGVLIKVFWHQWIGNLDGMNYAHSEFFQRLLDGGIVLLCAFILMLCFYVKNMNKVSKKEWLVIPNLCLIGFLLVMLIESVTEYYYFSVFISILAFLPEITQLYQQKNQV